MCDHVYTSKKFKKIRRSEGVPSDNVFLWPEEWSRFDLNLFQNLINIPLWVFQTQNWSLSALDLNPQLTKNLDIHHVWSIEKFSDRLQLYTHFWNKIWISIFVFPWRFFKRSNNFGSVHLSNFLYICLTQLTNIMYTRVSPNYNVCYIWSLTQLMIHR